MARYFTITCVACFCGSRYVYRYIGDLHLWTALPLMTSWKAKPESSSAVTGMARKLPRTVVGVISTGEGLTSELCAGQ